jgi:hypothetical protein
LRTEDLAAAVVVMFDIGFDFLFCWPFGFGGLSVSEAVLLSMGSHYHTSQPTQAFFLFFFNFFFAANSICRANFSPAFAVPTPNDIVLHTHKITRGCIVLHGRSPEGRSR